MGTGICKQNTKHYILLFQGFKVRLRGSGSASAGRVEVRHKAVWGTVNDIGWDIKDGDVVCKMLGYQAALEVFNSARYGEGTGPVWMSDLQCDGSESSLDKCPHAGWGSGRHSHVEDASVVCQEMTSHVGPGMTICFSYKIKQFMVKEKRQTEQWILYLKNFLFYAFTKFKELRNNSKATLMYAAV